MKTTSEDKAIKKALSKIGMKLAGEGPGWYVTVVVNGEAVRVWADDK